MYSQLAILSTLVLSTTAQMSFTNTPATTGRSTTTGPANNATPTLSVLVDDFVSGWAGSIISADPCATTIALQCTDDSSNAFCAVVPNGAITVTNYPSSYEFRYVTSTEAFGQKIEGTGAQLCALTTDYLSATQAVCEGSVSLSFEGQSTTFTSSSTISPLTYAQIPITAGASLLPSGSQTCTDTGNAAAPRATGIIREVCKVIVPIGAAAVAGALF